MPLITKLQIALVASSAAGGVVVEQVWEDWLLTVEAG